MTIKNFLHFFKNKNCSKQNKNQNQIKTKINLILPSLLLILALAPIKASAQQGLSAPTILIPKTSKITTAKPLIAGVSKNNTIVEIYLDNILLGQTQTRNHSSGVGNFFWQVVDPLTIGAHNIRVRAIDITNNQTSSFSNNLSINIIPFGGPTLLLPDHVNLTRPFSYITAVAYSNSLIKIFIDGLLQESFTIGSHPSGVVGFKHELNNPTTLGGTHTIYLQAQDQTGRVSIPSSIKIFNIVDFPAPTITVPENNFTTLNTNPIIGGVAFNDSLVKVFVDDKLDGETSIINHPSGVGHFSYTIKNNLKPGQYHKIITKALGPKGRTSAASKSINILTQYYYIPPTLLQVKANGAKPIISGVAHNNSTIKILVDGKLDSSLIPENHPSGTLYFEAQITKPLSYGVHKITAQAFDENQKPSQISNTLTYSLNAPEETESAVKQEIKPEPKQEIPTKTEAETSKEEQLKEESRAEIPSKEKQETDEINVIEPETQGKIKAPDEQEGKTVLETDKEETLPQDVGLPSTTNWPLVLGLILLIGLAVIFIGWYLGQKRRLLNKGIDQLFSDEQFDQSVKTKEKESPSTAKKSSNTTSETDTKPDLNIPPPPPEI